MEDIMKKCLRCKRAKGYLNLYRTVCQIPKERIEKEIELMPQEKRALDLMASFLNLNGTYTNEETQESRVFSYVQKYEIISKLISHKKELYETEELESCVDNVVKLIQLTDLYLKEKEITCSAYRKGQKDIFKEIRIICQEQIKTEKMSDQEVINEFLKSGMELDNIEEALKDNICGNDAEVLLNKFITYTEEDDLHGFSVRYSKLSEHNQQIVYEVILRMPKHFGHNLTRIMKLKGVSDTELKKLLWDKKMSKNASSIQSLKQCRKAPNSIVTRKGKTVDRSINMHRLCNALLIDEDILIYGIGMDYGARI